MWPGTVRMSPSGLCWAPVKGSVSQGQEQGPCSEQDTEGSEGRQPSSVSRTRREGEPAIQPAGAWSDSVKWGDRQRRQGYYKWPTHRHRAEHHASWDTVWKTQGQGEAQGGGQGEQDPHRWGQIWHEGCLGNVSTSHQDLINAIVMAANRVLAGTWQHINTCTAAKSVINMHIWTPCKSLQYSPSDCHFALRVIDVHHRKTSSQGSILMVDTVTPKTADFLFLAETDCDADTLDSSRSIRAWAWLRGKQNSSVFILFLENNYRLLSQLDRECYRITKIIVLQPGLRPSLLIPRIFMNLISQKQNYFKFKAL